jgi:hypothetical protein
MAKRHRRKYGITGLDSGDNVELTLCGGDVHRGQADEVAAGLGKSGSGKMGCSSDACFMKETSKRGPPQTSAEPCCI